MKLNENEKIENGDDRRKHKMEQGARKREIAIDIAHRFLKIVVIRAAEILERTSIGGSHEKTVRIKMVVVFNEFNNETE